MSPEKTKVKNAAYYAANRNRLRAGKKKYYAENCEAIKTKAKENRLEINAYMRQYLDKNPNARLAGNMRNRITMALKGVCKSSGTFDLLGCTKQELCVHLEKQFRPGMTWGNYGPVWHVDHIKPCITFNLTDPRQQKACFNYSNLRPLFAEENLRRERI